MSHEVIIFTKFLEDREKIADLSFGWKCYQIFSIYENFTAFLKLSGTPFNCAEDITAYYEIEDCGEIDELQVLFSEKENRVLPL